MTDEPFAQLRARQDQLARAIPQRLFQAQIERPPSFVGTVFAVSQLPTAPGQFFAVHPVCVWGNEVEGSSGALTVDTSSTVFVYMIGPRAPSAGDSVVCRFVRNRWVAELTSLPQTGGIIIPDCICTKTPPVLKMTCNNPASNGGIFQNCTIRYTNTPSEFGFLNLGAQCFLSDESFYDDSAGYSFRYYFTCYRIQYTLSRIYGNSLLGIPIKDIDRYTWLLSNPGNTCSPFLLSNGAVFAGGDPSTVVTIKPG
jgi:hypothetical protein